MLYFAYVWPEGLYLARYRERQMYPYWGLEPIWTRAGLRATSKVTFIAHRTSYLLRIAKRLNLDVANQLSHARLTQYSKLGRRRK